jgi:transcriptional regulator of met regulon
MSMATRTDTQSPALQVADRHELIRMHGARENNVKDVSVEIPKRRLTVFTRRLLRERKPGRRSTTCRVSGEAPVPAFSAGGLLAADPAPAA